MIRLTFVLSKARRSDSIHKPPALLVVADLVRRLQRGFSSSETLGQYAKIYHMVDLR